MKLDNLIDLSNLVEKHSTNGAAIRLLYYQPAHASAFWTCSIQTSDGTQHAFNLEDNNHYEDVREHIIRTLQS